MSFALALAIGAALMAGWLDVRFKERRPATLMRRACHLAAAYAILQVTSAGASYFVGANPGDARQLSVVFVILLPSLVYAFLTGLWLMRALVEMSGFARR